MKALTQAHPGQFRRKLQHSLLALSAVFVLSGAGLFLSEPAPQAVAAAGAAEAPKLVGDVATPALPTPADQAEVAPAVHTPSKKSRRSRHSAAMPFFSFSVGS